MNIQKWSNSIGRFGKFYFRYRGFTPYPIVLIFLFFSTPTLTTFCWGLAIMLLGEFFRIWSVAYIGKESRCRNVAADILITSGPYAYVRNPIYLANMIMYSGVTIIANIWMPWFLLVVWCYFGFQYYCIIQVESAALMEIFGKKFERYKASVPSFLPALAPFSAREQISPNYKTALVSEKSTLLGFSAMVLWLFFRMS